MNIGFMGLGKLGLPVALAVEEIGHKVAGWDPSESVAGILRNRELPYQEVGAQELLERSKIRMMNPADLSAWADLIFVAVQTPHQPEYEGITRLPETRADFSYEYLIEALERVDAARCPVVVISTVLPGTLASLGATHVLYNPFFIAMGTTIPDFRSPEFVLIGTDQAHPGLMAPVADAVAEHVVRTERPRIGVLYRAHRLNAKITERGQRGDHQTLHGADPTGQPCTLSPDAFPRPQVTQ